MTHLSEALRAYYRHDGRELRFGDKYSLNELALVMWESLGFRKVDSSVLSRVIHGERLFTPEQLEAFCTVLSLSKNEQYYLSACLRADHAIRLGVDSELIELPLETASAILQKITAQSTYLFYQGQFEELEENYDLVKQLFNSPSAKKIDPHERSATLGYQIYLAGRVNTHGTVPSHVLEKARPFFNSLVEMSKTQQDERLLGLAYVILSDAHYLAGGYSSSDAKRRSYRTSIQSAKRALEILPDNDPESLFALRAMTASATYLRDEEVIRYVLKRITHVIPTQTSSGRINALHLTATLCKGLASIGDLDPFAAKNFVSNYFKGDLTGAGIYEVSHIKEEVDTLILLRVSDKDYVRSRINEGISLATAYNLPRQRKYFKKLLRL